MKPSQLVSVALVVVGAAACGGGTAHLATKQPATKQPAANAATRQQAVAVTHGASPARCTSGGLSMRLGAAGGAAGSTYTPIVFTNKTSSACTLTGYPGVAFVAPSGGRQVGAPASRNPQHATTRVILAAGKSASALLQVANAGNYASAGCKPTTVSGLRVYPPGSTTANYIAFTKPHKACSTNVAQLHVEAVVSGSSGA